MPEVVSQTEAPEDGVSPSVRGHLREEVDKSLLDYLTELAAQSPIKVTVIREMPKSWEGRNIEGTLDRYDEPISEEEIRDLYGGGKYKLVIKAPNAKGQFQYVTSRRIKIAGDPKLDGLITTGSSRRSDESPSVVRDALSMSQSMIDRANRRADRAEERAEKGRGNQDSTTLSLVLEEMRSVRRESAAKDARLLEIVSSKPETSATEVLLGKAIEGESARILAMQSRMDSELRTRNDMHRAEIDRVSQRYDDIARRQEEAHKREIDSLRQSLDNQMATLKLSYEGQIQGFKREIAHLDRQLTVAQQEVVELRSKKDKSLLDSMTEMAAMKEAIETFSGGGKEEGSVIERVIGSVMGSSLAEGVAARIAGGPEAAAVPEPNPVQEQPDIPIDKPVQLPDGRVIVRRSDGRIMELRPKQKGPTPTGEPAPAISEENLKKILPFMESALANDADPGEFVRTARSLVPEVVSGPVQTLLKSQGADAFLALVTEVSPGSPLVSGQRGRNWVRKVAAILLE